MPLAVDALSLVQVEVTIARAVFLHLDVVVGAFLLEQQTPAGRCGAHAEGRILPRHGDQALQQGPRAVFPQQLDGAAPNLSGRVPERKHPGCAIIQVHVALAGLGQMPQQGRAQSCRQAAPDRRIAQQLRVIQVREPVEDFRFRHPAAP